MVGGGGEELGGVVVVAGCGGGSGAGRGRGLLLLLLSRCLVSNCSGSPSCWLELAYLAQIGVGGAQCDLSRGASFPIRNRIEYYLRLGSLVRGFPAGRPIAGAGSLQGPSAVDPTWASARNLAPGAIGPWWDKQGVLPESRVPQAVCRLAVPLTLWGSGSLPPPIRRACMSAPPAAAVAHNTILRGVPRDVYSRPSLSRLGTW